jgi:hypothetical protein
VGIIVAQQKLIGKVIDGNHGTWNLVVRIFVRNVLDSDTILVKKHYETSEEFSMRSKYQCLYSQC